jgi:hypothetical protein
MLLRLTRLSFQLLPMSLLCCNYVRSLNELLYNNSISGTIVPYMYTVRMPLAGKIFSEKSS